MKKLSKFFLLFVLGNIITLSFTFQHINNINLFTEKPNEDTLIFKGEKHFKNMKMLTHGGQNAEAYFSFDGKKFIFQGTPVPSILRFDSGHFTHESRFNLKGN